MSITIKLKSLENIQIVSTLPMVQNGMVMQQHIMVHSTLLKMIKYEDLHP